MSVVSALAVVLGSSYPLIPVYLDSFYRPWVNITFATAEGVDEIFTSQEVLLGISNGHSVVSRDSLDSVLTTITTLGNDPISVTDVISIPLYSSSFTLNVGPLSQLTREFGSSTLIKHSRDAVLALGVFEGDFRSHICENRRVISFPAHVGPIRIQLFETPFESLWFAAPHSIGDDLLTVPVRTYESLVDILGRSGADQKSAKDFDSCTTKTLENLPNIYIEAGHLSVSEDHPLVIHPSDYLTVTENDSCHLKISTNGEHDFIGINFLQLPRVNVRVSRDTILICDMGY